MSCEVTLHRLSDDGIQTIGEMVYQGERVCHTLELAWRDNRRSISCIPPGSYEVKYVNSPRFGAETYHITEVKGRSHIRIHVGNFYDQIEGCVLVGTEVKDLNGDGRLDVVNSRKALAHLKSIVGSPFTLHIENCLA